MKPLSKNNLSIIENHLIASNIRMKTNSKDVYNLKSTNNNVEIAKRCAPVNRAILRCNLGLNEKLEIATHQGKNLLNKRLDLVSKCRHFNKLLPVKFEDPCHGRLVLLPLKSVSKSLIPLRCFHNLEIPL